jgi:hypothetical protein
LVEERDWPNWDGFRKLLEVPSVIVEYNDGDRIRLWSLEQVENAEKDPELIDANQIYSC